MRFYSPHPPFRSFAQRVSMGGVVLWLIATAAPSVRGQGAVAIRPLDPVEARTVSYTLQIHGILENNCSGCHSGATPSGGLKVSSIAELLKGGKHGPAIVVGKPDDSLLVQYLRGIKTPQMPMGEKPLKVDDLHVIRLWILAGAKDDTAEQMAKNHGMLPDAADAAFNKLPVEDESALTLQQIREKHLARLPKAPAVPIVKAPTYNPIDNFVAAHWGAAQVPLVCDDATFVRRLYLDLTGHIPTTEQARAFITDPSADKRNRLIDTLLAEDDEYAANWIPFWEDALASNGKHQGGTGTRPNLRAWLMENLKKNRPYDEMVAELIDPTFTSPTSMESRGWIRNDDHTETLQSAAYTAQVFLGTELKCASCHNHFLNPEWPQRKFMAFASYFSPSDVEVVRCEVHEGEFLPPQFIFHEPAARQPVPKDLAGRLHLVSRLIVDPENPRFARSIVNRMWKRYFGLGLVEPADDFRADREPCNPELLTWLADDFMRHNFDLKHTIRLILTSRTYQLRFDPKLADSYNVSKPDLPRYYRSPGLRRLTAEQLLDSINVAIGNEAPRLFSNDDSTTLTRVLGKPASRNEISTARSDDVAVVQALELLNGEEFSQRIAAGKLSNALSKEADPAKIVSQAYWSIYNRPPTAAELTLGQKFLHSGQEGAGAVAPKTPQDKVWVQGQPPAGAHLSGTWNWVDSPAPIPGLGAVQKAHDMTVKTGNQQHFFTEAAEGVSLGAGDTLYCYVYLDPAASPRELMLQWNDGTWEHRAYWGENVIPFGTDASPSRLHLGPLPKAGGWVRLEIAANAVGLAGRQIRGMSFDQAEGHVFYGPSGVVQGAPANPAILDMLWALMVSPEFQYVR